MTTLKTIRRSGLTATLFVVAAVSAATMAMAVKDGGLNATTQHGAADDPMLAIEPRSVAQQAARTTIEHATVTTFESQVLRSNVPVIVDFYADWCGPCQIQARILDEFAVEFAGVKIVKVDVDESPELATRHDVEGLPTMLIFQNGEVMARQVGVATKQQLKTALAGGK
jgi:thioredoxin 1